jgi:uncharacterized protein (DUF305 family)
MVPHHESAIEMAKIAQKRADRQPIAQLAEDIVAAQDREIGQMRDIKERLIVEGVKKGDLGMSEDMKGMHTDAGMLEDAKPFDREFIDMMVPHHQGAIRMARVELDKGQNAELKKIAQAIVDSQAKEIEEMNAFRTDRYGSPSKAGACRQRTRRCPRTAGTPVTEADSLTRGAAWSGGPTAWRTYLAVPHGHVARTARHLVPWEGTQLSRRAAR